MSANNFSLKSGAKTVWLKRVLAIAVLAGFAWLVVSAVSNNMQDENLEPTLVQAPDMVKQRPEVPGGMKIDHQDKQLFDLLESESSSDAVNDAVVAKAQATESKNAELAKQAIEKKALAEKTAVKQVVVKQVAVAKPAPVAVVKPVEAKVAAVVKKVETKIATEVKTIEAKVVTSGWAVQLGSFRRSADAERAVGVYTKKVGNILVGLNSYVKKVNLGAKGIVYRVYFTGLKDGAHAKQVCAQLKVQKQACLRAKI